MKKQLNTLQDLNQVKTEFKEHDRTQDKANIARLLKIFPKDPMIQAAQLREEAFDLLKDAATIMAMPEVVTYKEALSALNLAKAAKDEAIKGQMRSIMGMPVMVRLVAKRAKEGIKEDAIRAEVLKDVEKAFKKQFKSLWQDLEDATAAEALCAGDADRPNDPKNLKAQADELGRQARDKFAEAKKLDPDGDRH